MNLTPSQTSAFWHKWNTIVRLHAWDRATSERERHALLKRAGFDSLTHVDKLEGFDRVLSELAAIQRPNDLEAQLREQTMPRTRLEFAVGKLSTQLSPARDPLAYARTISSDKFGTIHLDSLSDLQLLDLRNTLAARLCATKRRQRQNPPNSGQQLAA